MGKLNAGKALNVILRKGSKWDYKIRGIIGKKISNKRGLREDCYSYVAQAVWRAVERYDKKKSNGKTLKNWILLHVDNAIRDYLRKLYAKKNKQLVFRPFEEIGESDGTRMAIPDPEDNPDKPEFDVNSVNFIQQLYEAKLDAFDEAHDEELYKAEKAELAERRKAAEDAGDLEALAEIADQEEEFKSKAIDLKFEYDVPLEEEDYESEQQIEIERLKKVEADELFDENYIMYELAEANRLKNDKRRLAYERKKRKYGDVVSDYQYNSYEQSETTYQPILQGLMENLDEWELNIVQKMLEGYTITEIAKDLGYKDHSFISKELHKIRDKTTGLIAKGIIDAGTENEFITNSIYESSNNKKTATIKPKTLGLPAPGRPKDRIRKDKA